MQLIESYSIRGIREPIRRYAFGERLVDLWSPPESDHLLVTHDGQNIFDRRRATHGFTWRIAQVARKTFPKRGHSLPTVVAVFHSGSRKNPNGRTFDLSPEHFFREGMRPAQHIPQGISLENLNGDKYLDQIFDEIIPALIGDVERFSHANRALLGSSMGGLSTLYEVGRRPDRYGMAFAFSPHWTLVGDELVEKTISVLPAPGRHKVWMSRGTRKLDGQYEPHQNLADKMMRRKGWPSTHFRSKVYEGASHNERAWSRQIGDGFEFWLDQTETF